MSNKRSSRDFIQGTAWKESKIESNTTQKKTDGGGKTYQGGQAKKPKLVFSIGNKKSNLVEQSSLPVNKNKPSLKDVFNSDSEEEEEMPPEAKMRMRNIGRDTPTSAGPNSFGKTKQGFCDAKKVFEKKLKAAADESADSA